MKTQEKVTFKDCDREAHTLLCNLAQKHREFLKDLTILDSKLIPGHFRNAKAFSDIMVTKIMKERGYCPAHLVERFKAIFNKLK